MQHYRDNNNKYLRSCLMYRHWPNVSMRHFAEEGRGDLRKRKLLNHSKLLWLWCYSSFFCFSLFFIRFLFIWQASHRIWLQNGSNERITCIYQPGPLKTRVLSAESGVSLQFKWMQQKALAVHRWWRRKRTTCMRQNGRRNLLKISITAL